MQLLSLLVGLPRTVEYRGQSVTTGIFKSPVTGPLKLSLLNLEGDGQADLKVHGGAEKAVYAYGADAYPAWQSLRPKNEFPHGAMGENLTIDLLPEHEIYVGDTYSIGTAKIQACQPRFPCMKLGLKFNDPAILKDFGVIKRPGVYYRVIEAGTVQVGDDLVLLHREKTQVSIQEIYDLKKPDEDFARIREILTVPSLSSNWRKKLEGWLSSEK